jgi:hypothetical protein
MAVVLLIVFTLINCGALLQQRRWIYYLEFLRLLLTTTYLSIIWGSGLAPAAITLFIIVAAESFEWKKVYLHAVYGRSR